MLDKTKSVENIIYEWFLYWKPFSDGKAIYCSKGSRQHSITPISFKYKTIGNEVALAWNIATITPFPVPLVLKGKRFPNNAVDSWKNWYGRSVSCPARLFLNILLTDDELIRFIIPKTCWSMTSQLTLKKSNRERSEIRYKKFLPEEARKWISVYSNECNTLPGSYSRISIPKRLFTKILLSGKLNDHVLEQIVTYVKTNPTRRCT